MISVGGGWKRYLDVVEDRSLGRPFERVNVFAELISRYSMALK